MAEQNAFGDVPDFRRGGAHTVKPDLVSDLASYRTAALASDARGKHPGGKAAGLQNHDFAAFGESVIEEHLRDLGGFA